MSALVLPPGELDLSKAILQASRFSGAGYVHQYEGRTDWHVSQLVPRGVEVYFRVFANKIYVRTADKQEHPFGRIEDGAIIQEREPNGKPVPPRC